MLQVGFLGQPLFGVEQFAAADACPPDAHVVGVFQLGEVGLEAVGVQIVHLLLAREFLVACQGDDFHARRHHEERHVEAYLVVAGTRAAVGDGIGADFLGIAGNGDGLEDAFRAHRDGVAVIAQYVAENHVFQRLLIIFLRHVERHVCLRSQLVGVFLVGFQLFGAEASRVGACGINLISQFFCKVHDGVRRVESAAESHYNFFLLFHVFFLIIYCSFLFPQECECDSSPPPVFLRAGAPRGRRACRCRCSICGRCASGCPRSHIPRTLSRMPRRR